MYGFPCCTERVTNPEYDHEGNAYGKKGDDSCIIPKGCKRCVIIKTSSAPAPSTTYYETAMVTSIVTEAISVTELTTDYATTRIQASEISTMENVSTEFYTYFAYGVLDSSDDESLLMRITPTATFME
jgi:hypothetical protein